MTSEWVESEQRPFGWFSDEEGELYNETVARHPKSIIVELGTYLGRSLSYILETAVTNQNIIYAVDLWNWVQSSDRTIQCPSCSLDLLWSNLRRMKHENHVRLLVLDSVKAAERFPSDSVEVVMVDTTHRYEDTLREIDAWWPKLKTGGDLLLHDYHPTTFEVKRAVDERFGKPDKCQGTLCIIAKP